MNIVKTTKAIQSLIGFKNIFLLPSVTLLIKLREQTEFSSDTM
jgi:hypothetical protein